MAIENLLAQLEESHYKTISIHLDKSLLKKAVENELETRSIKYLRDNLLNRSTDELKTILVCLQNEQKQVKNQFMDKKNIKAKGGVNVA